jgi:hypothetical protein
MSIHLIDLDLEVQKNKRELVAAERRIQSLYKLIDAYEDAYRVCGRLYRLRSIYFTSLPVTFATTEQLERLKHAFDITAEG